MSWTEYLDSWSPRFLWCWCLAVVACVALAVLPRL